MKKLAGIRVVDLTQFLPGPMMTLMMADHGAEVTKVEPPGGDPARHHGPFEAGQSVWFRNLNRGKASVVLDLKTDAGRDALWALIDGADVFVESFRPGVAERLGFGWEAVAARCPRLVYCSISAFGQSGSASEHPAHDLAVQALAGFVAAGGNRVPGVAAADMAAGLSALSGVLMALLARERSGRGDRLDIAMFDALLPWSAHVIGDAIAGAAATDPAAQRSLGGAAFYQVYRCADGGHVALGGREAKFAAVLLNALGRPDLLPLAEAPPGPAQAPLTEFLSATFATRGRDDWTAWFAGRDVAFAPVLDFGEAAAAAAARGGVVQHDGAHQFAPAIRFAGDGWQPRAAPDLGA